MYCCSLLGLVKQTHLKDVKALVLPDACGMEDRRPVLPLPPGSPMWQGLPAEGEWCKAGHDSHVCTLLRLQYPPRRHYGLL